MFACRDTELACCERRITTDHLRIRKITIKHRNHSGAVHRIKTAAFPFPGNDAVTMSGKG
jgi:hypothetical protein